MVKTAMVRARIEPMLKDKAEQIQIISLLHVMHPLLVVLYHLLLPESIKMLEGVA
jgi:hypothetical protein